MKLRIFGIIVPSLVLAAGFSGGTPAALAAAPSAPLNLAIVSVWETKVGLEWRDNSNNENNFLLYRSTAADFSAPVIVPLPADASSHTDTGLTTGTNYYYQLYACNDDGCMGSNVVSGAPSTVLPQNFAAATRSACAINLSWTESSAPGSVGYYVEYTNAADFVREGQPVGSTTGNSIQHSGLPIDPSLTYRYHIQAVNLGDSSEVSGWSDPVTAKTAALEVPGVPADFSVAGKSGGQQAELSWSMAWVDEKLAEQYGAFEIHQSADGTNFTRIDVASSSYGNVYTTLPNLDPSREYWYKIKALITDEGCAPDVGLKSDFTTAVKMPKGPTELTAAYQFQPSQVNLTWTAGAGQDSYEIWRATSTNPLALVATTSTNSFVDINPESSGKYSYKVRGCTTGGCSDFSNIAQVTIADAPLNLAARIFHVATSTGAGRILLAWDNTFPNPPSSGNYVVERSENGGSFSPIGSPIALKSPSFTEITYIDSQVSLGKNYSYRVKVDFGGSSSNYSLPAAASMDISLVLYGQAWASVAANAGVGWISFHSGTQSPYYSVQIDKTGLMSGRAWSGIESYGYLSFEKNDLAGCPSGTCEARFNSSTGEVSGWARFLGLANYHTDGWVSLRGTNGSVSWGVSYNSTTGNFAGQAWGSDVVGWIAFSDSGCSGKCTVGGFVMNQPPVVSNVAVSRDPNAWCAETPYYRISWDYSDPDGDLQQSAEVSVVAGGSATNTTTLQTGDHSTTLNDPIGVLGASQSFQAAVRVSDGKAWSNQATSTATTTPAYYYPLADFDYNPKSAVNPGRVLDFIDISTTTDRGGTAIVSWLWDFSSTASPASARTSSTKEVVRKVPVNVSLTVTNTTGDSCEVQGSVDAAGSAAGVKRRIFRER